MKCHSHWRQSDSLDRFEQVERSKTFVLILYPMFFLFFLGLGDFNSFDMRRPNELKKLQQKIRDEGWQLSLVDSQSAHSDEKDFNKLLSLHWFYLTEAPSLNKEY